ncbi:hypothetical protein [Photorhabdus bodei]|uniref:hypothetical protein n=1 Tax=Photorhabdus bodei TaxID=2029681 RepID=UPI001EE41800|nr:hypothetical protein [Photorhabdus bodei]
MSYFFDTAVNIEGNKKLRMPQIEAYIKIREYFNQLDNKKALARILEEVKRMIKVNEIIERMVAFFSERCSA